MDNESEMGIGKRFDKPEQLIDNLAQFCAKQFDRIDERFAAVDTRFDKVEQRIGGIDKRVDGLAYNIDQLDQKLDQHRQETKDGFAATHRFIGGISTTLADHEERISTLEQGDAA